MTKILLSGCHGRMGRAVLAATQNTDLTVISGTDINAGTSNFPVYTNIADAAEIPDVIIDFSHHTALPAIMDYAVKNNVPCVICTTGHTEEEYNVMYEAAKSIPVFFSRNMSLGVNTLLKLVAAAAQVFAAADFDMEIVEKHHNRKVDAPSGTALAIADAMNEVLNNEYAYKFDRSQERKMREKKEIGISAVRGGTIVGEHEVIFAGADEVIEIKHTAYSKAIFGNGALQAAKFLAGKPAGMYNMSDVIG